jgi:hypothetical protein
MKNSGANIMSALRLVLLAVGLFALTFVGVSWAEKGFPVMAVRVVPLKPDARLPTFEESVQRGIRKDWENAHTLQSDGDRERDKLRLDLLQASTGYELSPCSDVTKTALVAALTHYIDAWLSMVECTPGVGACPRGSKSARLDAAAAAFGTPADVNAREALHKAIEQGGIAPEDFPSAIRDYVFMWSGGRPIGEPQAACIIARQSENRR